MFIWKKPLAIVVLTHIFSQYLVSFIVLIIIWQPKQSNKLIIEAFKISAES
jgi:hypothetical protein